MPTTATHRGVFALFAAFPLGANPTARADTATGCLTPRLSRRAAPPAYAAL